MVIRLPGLRRPLSRAHFEYASALLHDQLRYLLDWLRSSLRREMVILRVDGVRSCLRRDLGIPGLSVASIAWATLSLLAYPLQTPGRKLVIVTGMALVVAVVIWELLRPDKGIALATRQS